MTLRSLFLSTLLVATASFAAPAASPSPTVLPNGVDKTQIAVFFAETQSSADAGAAQASVATIVSVDAATRNITLKRADGSIATTIAPMEMRNFPQIKVGDSVNTVEAVNLEVSVLKSNIASISEGRFERISRPELGAKPGTVLVHGMEIVADVIAIDPVGQTITLEGALAERVIKIQNPANLSKVKVGDQIAAVITEVVTIQVSTPATPAAK
jgi:Cu/Ag efflux protein CusF